jgi:G3E family GTPase
MMTFVEELTKLTEKYGIIDYAIAYTDINGESDQMIAFGGDDHISNYTRACNLVGQLEVAKVLVVDKIDWVTEDDLEDDENESL